MNYQDFVATKLERSTPTGIVDAVVESPHLFAFQRDLVQWALRRGRAALFCATGLGKSRMQVTWADAVVKHTGKPVLILAPLAVAAQTAREGVAIGIDVRVCREAADVGPGINIANYERLHLFDPSMFDGVVWDESSICKSFNGKTLAALLLAFSNTPFRLACTATPSPNDYTELGNHAELLGVCSRAEMLSEYFVHDGGETQKWRLKGHARAVFWRFVASWGALVRSPADLGYDATDYDLPALTVEHHIIPADEESTRAAGLLFAEPAAGLMERRQARRGSIGARVARLVEMVEWENHALNTGALTTQPIVKSDSRISAIQDSDTLRSATLTTPYTGSPTKIGCENTSGSTTGPTPTPIEKDPSEKISARTDSTNRHTSRCLKHNSGCVPSADADKPSAGDSTSTTTTPTEECGASSATSATCDSAATERARRRCLPRATTPPPSTCESREKWLVWCQLNTEQDALEKLFQERGISCVSIQGSTPFDDRESMELEWRMGRTQVLITKPKCFGFGLNWQHCSRMAFVGVDDSWESYHQAVRRCWRFGQTKPVAVHVFASELEGAVVENLKRKERDAEAMAAELSAETAGVVRAEVRGARRQTNEYRANEPMQKPSWLTGSAS
jgi:superfamily II DNA or RNA helicase